MKVDCHLLKDGKVTKGVRFFLCGHYCCAGGIDVIEHYYSQRDAEDHGWKFRRSSRPKDHGIMAVCPVCCNRKDKQPITFYGLEKGES